MEGDRAIVDEVHVMRAQRRSRSGGVSAATVTSARAKPRPSSAPFGVIRPCEPRTVGRLTPPVLA